MNKEIKDTFQEVTDSVQKLHNALLDTGYEGTQAVFERAMKVYGCVGKFLWAVEDADSNLNPEVHNLPDMDELFAGDPVSKYVHAAINYAQSEGNPEAEEVLKAAALEVAESQKVQEECEEDCCSHCCPCDLTHLTLAGYIELNEEDYAAHVMENMDLIEEELKGKTVFSKADLYLIRYYLKNLPDNSAYQIESLTDAGLVIAWNFTQMRKKMV